MFDNWQSTSVRCLVIGSSSCGCLLIISDTAEIPCRFFQLTWQLAMKLSKGLEVQVAFLEHSTWQWEELSSAFWTFFYLHKMYFFVAVLYHMCALTWYTPLAGKIIHVVRSISVLLFFFWLTLAEIVLDSPGWNLRVFTLLYFEAKW